MYRKMFLAIAAALLATCATAKSAEAANFYVSKNGNNADGRTWQTAWNEFDQIQWGAMRPGDTLYLDGGKGNSSMTYFTTLQNYTAPGITISRTFETNHNGLVIVDGQSQSSPTGRDGIVIAVPRVKLEGLGWRGISIRNFVSGTGLMVWGETEFILVRNVECKNCRVGANLSGNETRFDQLVLHDNHQSNLTMKYTRNNQRVSLTSSWVYNSVENPNPNYNLQPGIETSYSGALLTLNRCVVGPGLDVGVMANSSADILNCLFINATAANIRIHYPQLVSVRNSTFFSTSLNQAGFTRDNISSSNIGPVPLKVDRSIFYGGRIGLPPGRYGTGSTQFNVTGNTTAMASSMVDPKFTSNVATVPINASVGSLNQLNFSLLPDSPSIGQGSALSSSKTLVGP